MKEKKRFCVLHGALSNSNFGDYLFGAIFLKKSLEVRPDRVLIADMPRFGVSQKFREEMHYNLKCGLRGFIRADLLVYISGGYFGEIKKGIKPAIKRYLRYFLIGQLAMLLKKRIVVIGVGGGPLDNWALRKAACSIIQYADVVTFRDMVSYAYFSKYIDCSSVEVTSDTALIIDESMIPPLDEKGVREMLPVSNCPKKILIHLADHKETDELMLKLVNPINQFLLDNPEYGVVFSYDGYEDMPIDEQPIVRLIKTKYKSVYHYHGVWQLCSLINNMDCVVTGKLHMGIVSSRLGKSVLSFPYNSGKVVRYYEQICEPERCCALETVSEKIATSMLNRFCNESIKIPDDLVKKAHRNIELLQKALM